MINKIHQIKYSLIIFIPVLLLSCIKPKPFEPTVRTAAQDNKDEVFIINGLAETISIINCANLTIQNDVFETGLWPNHLCFNNGNGYLINSGENSIQVFDETTLTPLYSIDIGVNSNPWMTILRPETSTGYVPNFVSGDVAVVNLIQQQVYARIKVGTGPEGGALIETKLYIANTSWNYEIYDFLQGTVSVINTANNQVIKTINTDKNPQHIIAFPARKEVHVICTGKNGGSDSDDGKINIINTDTDTIIHTINIGGSPGAYAVHSDDKIVYLTGVGGVQAYNFETREIVYGSANYLIAGQNPDNDFFSGITIDPIYQRIYICNFTYDKIIVLSSVTKTKITEIQGSDGPQIPVYHHEP